MITLTSVVKFIAPFLDLLLRAWAYIATALWSREVKKNDQLEIDLEAKARDATAWANAPKSEHDTVHRLRVHARKQRHH